MDKEKNNEPLTRVWQKWRFSAPQTHLWLIKVLTRPEKSLQFS